MTSTLREARRRPQPDRFVARLVTRDILHPPAIRRQDAVYRTLTGEAVAATLSFGWPSLVFLAASGCSASNANGGDTCGPGTEPEHGVCVVAQPAVDASAEKSEAAATEAGAVDVASEATEAAVAEAGGATVVVALRWVYFVTENTCQQPVTCTSSETCPPAGDCSCVVCANPPNCIANTITPNCCIETATIDASNLGQLVTDYAACTLTQTSPSTYALECGIEATPSLYWSYNGSKLTGGIKYTTDMPCSWALPYAVVGGG